MSDVPQAKTFPASPSTVAADVAKVATDVTAAVKEDSGGIVAIAATDHAAAKGVFTLLRDKVAQGVTDLEAELSKVAALLHL
jgi:hypothetical protein